MGKLKRLWNRAIYWIAGTQLLPSKYFEADGSLSEEGRGLVYWAKIAFLLPFVGVIVLGIYVPFDTTGGVSIFWSRVIAVLLMAMGVVGIVWLVLGDRFARSVVEGQRRTLAIRARLVEEGI